MSSKKATTVKYMLLSLSKSSLSKALVLIFIFILVPFQIFSQSYEAKIKEFGISLPKPTTPVANYVKAVTAGKLVFLAGHGPTNEEGELITGKVGVGLSIEDGYDAARRTGLSLLSSLRAEIGSLDRVKRIVKVKGMVNTTPDFTQHPEVINGCSDLLVQVFGENGKHARAAVGMVSLPRNIAVEIEMIVEIK